MAPLVALSAVLRGSSPFSAKSFPSLVGVSEALTGNRSLWPSPAFGTLRENPYNTNNTSENRTEEQIALKLKSIIDIIHSVLLGYRTQGPLRPEEQHQHRHARTTDAPGPLRTGRSGD